jgi:hypothetical protein
VTLNRVQRFAAQRDTVIDQHVIANLSGFSDYHSYAVINHQSTTDGCAWMNFNAREKLGVIREYARKNSSLPLP